MEKYYDILENVSLFKDIEANQIRSLLKCLNAQVKNFKKEETIIFAGDKIEKVGIILDGTVTIQKEDIKGNRNILTQITKYGIFAEVFACIGMKKSPVTIVSETDSVIMFIDFKYIITSCSNACEFHTSLVKNMLTLIVEKNLALNNKVSCLGKRTLREKVEMFLALQMENTGRRKFEIPFSRLEMADYLCVDRSALSAILCKMRDEGVIKFNKNRFEVIKNLDT